MSTPTEEDVTDVFIIGGGYAGLSAASTAYRATHRVTVFDSGEYRSTRGSDLHILPTYDYKQPGDFRAASRSELAKTGRVNFVDSKVESVSKKPSGRWVITDTSGVRREGRTVVLATGVDDVLPSIPGYEECWIKGIFPCMFQFGYEERGSSSAGILAVDRLGLMLPHTIMLVSDARRFADKVTIYTAGDEKVASSLRDLLAAQGDTQTLVDSRAIKRLVKTEQRSQVRVELADGQASLESFLVHQPNTKLRGKLADDLGLELLPSGEIKVSTPFPETSVPGVFAAGDCASPLKVASLAVSAGVLAGNGVSRKVALVA